MSSTTQKKTACAAVTSNDINMRLYAFPTMTPSYFLEVTNNTSGRVLHSGYYKDWIGGTRDKASKIRDALKTDDLVPLADGITRAEVLAVRHAVYEYLVDMLEGLLYGVGHFNVPIAHKVALKARRLCYRSNLPIDAIATVLDHIPPDADWSDKKNIYKEKNGVVDWYKATFAEAHSVWIGYPIMLERLRRTLDAKRKTFGAGTGAEVDEEEVEQVEQVAGDATGPQGPIGQEAVGEEPSAKRARVDAE